MCVDFVRPGTHPWPPPSTPGTGTRYFRDFGIETPTSPGSGVRAGGAFRVFCGRTVPASSVSFSAPRLKWLHGVIPPVTTYGGDPHSNPVVGVTGPGRGRLGSGPTLTSRLVVVLCDTTPRPATVEVSGGRVGWGGDRGVGPLRVPVLSPLRCLSPPTYRVSVPVPPPGCLFSPPCRRTPDPRWRLYFYFGVLTKGSNTNPLFPKVRFRPTRDVRPVLHPDVLPGPNALDLTCRLRGGAALPLQTSSPWVATTALDYPSSTPTGVPRPTHRRRDRRWVGTVIVEGDCWCLQRSTPSFGTNWTEGPRGVRPGVRPHLLRPRFPPGSRHGLDPSRRGVVPDGSTRDVRS